MPRGPHEAEGVIRTRAIFENKTALCCLFKAIVPYQTHTNRVVPPLISLGVLGNI